METLDGHGQTQPSACLYSKKFLEALWLLPARIQTSLFTAAGRDVCGGNKSELPPCSIATGWLSQCTLLENVVGAVLQEGFIPSVSTHSLLKSFLKSELHVGFSLITGFVQSLPSLWPLSVPNTKRGEPKLLFNLLNSRAKAIPTLCSRLLLLVIQ